MTGPDLEELAAWRRDLHRHPDPSGAEARTAEMVCARLSALGPDALVTGLGGHGVLARFSGQTPTRRLLLRCELDGLPIAETNTFAHRSRVPGHGHLCGHDGHMAILMGVARALAAERAPNLDVLLLFQPAEETGAGAQAVLDDPAFAEHAPDVAICLHNVPGLPLGQIAARPGPACCASRGLRIVLRGRTAHASQPETGLSPAGAMMRIMAEMRDLDIPPETGAPSPRMVTLTHARLGVPSFGIAPGEAELRVTLRTIADDDMQDLCARAEAVTWAACEAAGLEMALSYHDVFPAVINDAAVVGLIETAAEAAAIPFRPQPHPMRWSEDFGRFGSIAKSAIFLLGAGEDTPALHNPDYDFPDALIETGVTAFRSIIAEMQARA